MKLGAWPAMLCMQIICYEEVRERERERDREKRGVLGKARHLSSPSLSLCLSVFMSPSPPADTCTQTINYNYKDRHFPFLFTPLVPSLFFLPQQVSLLPPLSPLLSSPLLSSPGWVSFHEPRLLRSPPSTTTTTSQGTLFQMLRKINRAIDKDQIKAEMMSESLNSSSDSLSQKASFFRVSGLFVRLSTKGLMDPDLAWSPTSPLDLKTFSNLGSFTLMSPKSPNVEPKQKTWDSSKVGLGLIDALKEENPQVGSRKVLIGSEFKKPTPDPLAEPNKAESFEMKIDQVSSSLSMKEIAESEDYTCITTHGPNPTKTHIFGDCILETPKGFTPEQDTFWFIEPLGSSQDEVSGEFLKICGYCNKKLPEGKDIYMYLGEKAFCTRECRSYYMGEETEEAAIMDESLVVPNLAE